MAVRKSITPHRRETVHALESIAVRARRAGDRATWEIPRHEWEIRATAAEKRHAPAALVDPWRA